MQNYNNPNYYSQYPQAGNQVYQQGGPARNLNPNVGMNTYGMSGAQYPGQAPPQPYGGYASPMPQQQNLVFHFDYNDPSQNPAAVGGYTMAGGPQFTAPGYQPPPMPKEKEEKKDDHFNAFDPFAPKPKTRPGQPTARQDSTASQPKPVQSPTQIQIIDEKPKKQDLNAFRSAFTRPPPEIPQNIPGLNSNAAVNPNVNMNMNINPNMNINQNMNTSGNQMYANSQYNNISGMPQNQQVNYNYNQMGGQQNYSQNMPNQQIPQAGSNGSPTQFNANQNFSSPSSFSQPPQNQPQKPQQGSNQTEFFNIGANTSPQVLSQKSEIHNIFSSEPPISPSPMPMQIQIIDQPVTQAPKPTLNTMRNLFSGEEPEPIIAPVIPGQASQSISPNQQQQQQQQQLGFGQQNPQQSGFSFSSAPNANMNPNLNANFDQNLFGANPQFQQQIPQQQQMQQQIPQQMQQIQQQQKAPAKAANDDPFSSFNPIPAPAKKEQSEPTFGAQPLPNMNENPYDSSSMFGGQQQQQQFSGETQQFFGSKIAAEPMGGIFGGASSAARTGSSGGIPNMPIDDNLFGGSLSKPPSQSANPFAAPTDFFFGSPTPTPAQTPNQAPSGLAMNDNPFAPSAGANPFMSGSPSKQPKAENDIFGESPFLSAGNSSKPNDLANPNPFSSSPFSQQQTNPFAGTQSAPPVAAAQQQQQKEGDMFSSNLFGAQTGSSGVSAQVPTTRPLDDNPFASSTASTSAASNPASSFADAFRQAVDTPAVPKSNNFDSNPFGTPSAPNPQNNAFDANPFGNTSPAAAAPPKQVSDPFAKPSQQTPTTPATSTSAGFGFGQPLSFDNNDQSGGQNTFTFGNTASAGFDGINSGSPEKEGIKFNPFGVSVVQPAPNTTFVIPDDAPQQLQIQPQQLQMQQQQQIMQAPAAPAFDQSIPYFAEEAKKRELEEKRKKDNMRTFDPFSSTPTQSTPESSPKLPETQQQPQTMQQPTQPQIEIKASIKASAADIRNLFGGPDEEAPAPEPEVVKQTPTEPPQQSSPQQKQQQQQGSNDNPFAMAMNQPTFGQPENLKEEKKGDNLFAPPGEVSNPFSNPSFNEPSAVFGSSPDANPFGGGFNPFGGHVFGGSGFGASPFGNAFSGASDPGQQATFSDFFPQQQQSQQASNDLKQSEETKHVVSAAAVSNAFAVGEQPKQQQEQQPASPATKPSSSDFDNPFGDANSFSMFGSPSSQKRDEEPKPKNEGKNPSLQDDVDNPFAVSASPFSSSPTTKPVSSQAAAASQELDLFDFTSSPSQSSTAGNAASKTDINLFDEPVQTSTTTNQKKSSEEEAPQIKNEGTFSPFGGSAAFNPFATPGGSDPFAQMKQSATPTTTTAPTNDPFAKPSDAQQPKRSQLPKPGGKFTLPQRSAAPKDTEESTRKALSSPSSSSIPTSSQKTESKKGKDDKKDLFDDFPSDVDEIDKSLPEKPPPFVISTAIASNSNPFAVGGAPPASNPFATGTPAANPFASGAASPASNPFGGAASPASNPFGGAASPASNPFGGAASPAAAVDPFGKSANTTTEAKKQKEDDPFGDPFGMKGNEQKKDDKKVNDPFGMNGKEQKKEKQSANDDIFGDFGNAFGSPQSAAESMANEQKGNPFGGDFGDPFGSAQPKQQQQQGETTKEKGISEEKKQDDEEDNSNFGEGFSFSSSAESGGSNLFNGSGFNPFGAQMGSGEGQTFTFGDFNSFGSGQSSEQGKSGDDLTSTNVPPKENKQLSEKVETAKPSFEEPSISRKEEPKVAKSIKNIDDVDNPFGSDFGNTFGQSPSKEADNQPTPVFGQKPKGFDEAQQKQQQQQQNIFGSDFKETSNTSVENKSKGNDSIIDLFDISAPAVQTSKTPLSKPPLAPTTNSSSATAVDFFNMSNVKQRGFPQSSSASNFKDISQKKDLSGKDGIASSGMKDGGKEASTASSGGAPHSDNSAFPTLTINGFNPFGQASQTSSSINNKQQPLQSRQLFSPDQQQQFTTVTEESSEEEPTIAESPMSNILSGYVKPPENDFYGQFEKEPCQVVLLPKFEQSMAAEILAKFVKAQYGITPTFASTYQKQQTEIDVNSIFNTGAAAEPSDNDDFLLMI